METASGRREPRGPGLQAGQVALVGPQQLPVDPGDIRHARVTAGKAGEARQVGLVLRDGARRGAAVELEPAEVLGERLGKRVSRASQHVFCHLGDDTLLAG